MIKKILKYIVIVFTGIVFLFAGLATYLLVFFEPDSYRSEIQTQINEVTGLNIKINDYIGWSIFPILGIEVHSIVLSDPTREGNIFRLRQLKFGLAILPLLTGKIEVDQVIADGLSLNLRTDQKGENNWSPLVEKLVSGKKSTPVQKNKSPKSVEIFNFSLRSLSFVNTKIVYANLKEKFRTEVNDLSLTTKNFAFGKESEIQIKFAGGFEQTAKKIKHTLKGTSDFKINISKNLKIFDISSFDLQTNVFSSFLKKEGVPLRLKIVAFADLEKQSLSVRFFELNVADLFFARNKTEAVSILEAPVANTSLMLELTDIKKTLNLLEPGFVPKSVLEILEKKSYALDTLLVAKIDLPKDELIASKLNFSLNNNLKFSGNLYISNLRKEFSLVLNEQFKAKNLLFLVPQKISLGNFKTLPLEGDIKLKLDWKTKKLTLNLFDLTTSGTKLSLTKTQAFLDPKTLSVSGWFNFKTSKLGKIAKLYLPDLFKGKKAKNLSSVALESDFVYGDNKAKLNRLGIVVDETKIEGTLSYDLKKKFTVAKLTGESIDLDRYLPEPEQKPKEKSVPEERKPFVYSKDKLIPAEPLKQFGADVELTFKKIIFKKIPITALDVKLFSADGEVNLQKLNFQIFSGSGQTSLRADFRKEKQERISLESRFFQIPSGKILETFTKKRYVDGDVNLNIALNLKGNSVHDFVHSLTGDIKFDFKKGVLNEYNVEQYVCKGIATINQREINPKLYPPKTDFKQLKSSVRLKNGEASPINFDSNIAGFLLEGRGMASLPKQNFDFGLSMLVRGKTTDPACRVEKQYSSIKWPVKCSGVFHGKPINFCKPDLNKIKGQVADALQKIGAQLIKQKTRELQKEVKKKKKETEKDIKKEVEKALKGLLPF